MDEACTHCAALCETRSRVVHGYGDVAADFLFVGEMPDADADRTGVPFTGSDAGERVLGILRRLGLCGPPGEATEPVLANAYLTNLTRCHHPERSPTDAEIGNCEPFLNAEVRMINPEILVALGDRALATLLEDYSTTAADAVALPDCHGDRIRGRGFEIVPTIDPASMTDDEADAFVYAFSELMASDYRQTKGRRSR